MKYFLEQCLCSVEKAIAYGGWAGGQDFSDQVEVLVVDNCSTDGSVDWLRPRFPFVQFIANTENVGFSRANNQVLGKCRGKYVLFLNPDTILPEDCFQQCLSFMDVHPDAGALGVHMIDGSGRYLPESKRGFPTPWVSFCKMSGLTGFFPTSKWLAGYYLGHLSPAGTHQVDVLSGAFMWVRKEVLDKTGGFDERFFMYAEDIDLSFRIQQAGYVNYYLPAPAIIHFKGESTRKDKRYVKLFYTAMIQFVEKHYKGIGAWGYTKLLQGIIWLKGAGKGNPVREKTEVSGHTKIVLTGDAAAMKEMHNLIDPVNDNIVTDETVADTFIYCEGQSFTFSAIIKKLQAGTAGKSVFVHGSQTGCAVGSGTKECQGNVIGNTPDR
ncbi:MAG: glycosyltransferase family 2 protein [Niastella sp.]|nr:glycosyltransferase family 2 protein [Niastella sp.]